MKVHQMLICIFILSLQDGNTGLINAQVITGKEGGSITYGCIFTFSGSRKIFCKEECEEKDILVETTDDRAQRGRYSIEWKEAADLLSSPVLYVRITNLTKSDSRRYTCRLDRGYISNKHFEIRVEDALITKPTQTLRPRPTSVPSTSTPTTTQSLDVGSGSSTPSSASTDTSNQSGGQQGADGQISTDVLLYVGLALVTMVIMLSVAVLYLCRRRASKPKGQPVETEYANMTEANRVYEEIRQDEEGGSPPVEIATVYTSVKYVKSNDSNKLTYSEVDFSNSTAASLNSAPRGDADNVVYSVPQGAASDGSRVEDASPPLYSAVTLPHE